jgi:ubiquinone biosynthesis monooxygenase Coq7
MTDSGTERYDISVVRPAIVHDQIALRGRELSLSARAKVQKALRTFHSLEIMAVNTYRFQITGQVDPLNRELIAAMCNEMTHVQDFAVKLYEYGMTPSLFRWAWWLVGFVIGFGSRLLGRKAIFKTGIFVETKAVHHYAELLGAADWDEATRRMIEKDQADEDGHIRTWSRLLSELS